jgi:hypothetical protein
MEGRGVFFVDNGVGQWGGGATIMMCGCDGGGWYSGDASLKSVFARIQAVNHGSQFSLPVTRVYRGG